MRKFNLFDHVRMRDVIFTSYVGQVGRIVGAKPNKRREETLDKYIVRFDNGQTVEAWSIQLEPVNPELVA